MAAARMASASAMLVLHGRVQQWEHHAWLSRKTASNAAPVDAAGKVKHMSHDIH